LPIPSTNGVSNPSQPAEATPKSGLVLPTGIDAAMSRDTDLLAAKPVVGGMRWLEPDLWRMSQ
jgi:hypothetical protein